MLLNSQNIIGKTYLNQWTRVQYIGFRTLVQYVVSELMFKLSFQIVEKSLFEISNALLSLRYHRLHRALKRALLDLLDFYIPFCWKFYAKRRNYLGMWWFYFIII